jgi:peptidylprolyl isomerase
MTDQAPTAEPQADQPTTAEQAANAKRRGQAIAGALAGLGVVAALVAAFVVVQVSGADEASAPSAAAPAASAPAEAPPSEPAAPQAEPSAPAPPADLPPALKNPPTVKGGKGRVAKLDVKPLITGTGPAVAAGQTIAVNYIGVTYADGKVFDSSWQRGQPWQTRIGVGEVIPGFDQGLVGVKVGSRVQLDIPAEMAYGEKPQGGAPAGDLRFVVDVLAAQ